ncbi:50S ribosomal protein L25/general stress protein Ctc [Marinicella sediminis]|uniref:Large ribosomal subunit protein bL25 n=1 Tax=Marinicella sediminis TaxID=1792834 RepID=A0ABV7JBN9_9GAMM|nr:50S ribosomal protein L25/general stress protein Ctc [Marinicella sediminis]
MAIFKVDAEVREDVGKGASRRLRHAGLVPVVLYGGGRDPRNLTLNHNKVLRLIEDEAFFSSIIEFSADGGKKQKVVLKDVQRHPAKPVIMHMDFMRVDDKHEIVMNVPLHFEGGEDSPAGKSSRVMIDYQMNEVEITCFPKDLPEFISVDVSAFTAGDNLHLSDLKLPEGVTLVAFTHGENETHDAVVVSTSAIGQAETEETAESEAATEEDSKESED